MTNKSIPMSSGESNQLKTCFDCGVSKTPLWRTGPAGPKSLCNACGLRTRKRTSSSRLDKDAEKSKKRSEGVDTKSHVYDDEFTESLRNRLVNLGSEGVEKSRSQKFEQMRKLTEEEQAALLLMTFSRCSSLD